MKIKKAIIPCGGMGTRFFPVTKAIPKGILPVIDTPVLAYIVDELEKSGIEEIMIILGRGMDIIKEYFTPNKRLEKALEHKPDLLAQIKEINKNGRISFGLQSEPRGTGDAVLCARDFTGDEPFAMCNSDDLTVSDIPVSKQLIDAYEKTPAVIVGVQQVDPSETYKYGVMRPTKIDGRTIWCDGMVEKPKTNPPSRYAAFGRYILTPEIYEVLDKTEYVNGELQLTDAICTMMKENKVYAYDFEGKRYDMGNKFGALTATVDFALKRPEFGEKFKAYIKSVLSDEA